MAMKEMKVPESLITSEKSAKPETLLLGCGEETDKEKEAKMV